MSALVFAAEPYLTLQKLEKDKKPWSVRVCVRNGYTVDVQVFIKRVIKLSPNLTRPAGVCSLCRLSKYEQQVKPLTCTVEALKAEVSQLKNLASLAKTLESEIKSLRAGNKSADSALIVRLLKPSQSPSTTVGNNRLHFRSR